MIKPKKPPYAGTQVDAYNSQVKITKLLESFGIEGVQWTTLFREGKVELRFPIETEIDGVKKNFMVKLQPPSLKEKHRTYDPVKGRHVVEEAPNWSQSMRLLYWYVKSKIEAIAYGLVSAEEEFLSDIVYALPDGQESTIGKIITKKVVEGRLALGEGEK